MKQASGTHPPRGPTTGGWSRTAARLVVAGRGDTAGIICLASQRLVDLGADKITPGVAASEYDRIKMAKYADQDSFMSFSVETGGRINRAGLQFLDRRNIAIPTP